MSEKREGTFHLDGLLEGHLPALPGAADRLRQWADQGVGPRRTIRFSLDLDGGRFNLLADNHPAPVADLSEPLADTLAFALEDLLKAFPPSDRPKVFSTLRSIEYQPRQEVQTLYTVGPRGRIQVQQQTVDADTVPPPVPFASPHRRRQLALAASITLLLLALSTFFIDYRHLFALLTHPPSAQSIALDNAAFAPYFTVEKAGLDSRGDTLTLRLTRTPAYPLTDSDFTTESTPEPATLPSTLPTTLPTTQPTTMPLSPFRRRLALDALAHGYLRCECFSDKNEFLGSSLERIADLRTHPTLDLPLRLPHDGSTPILPHHITLTY